MEIPNDIRYEFFLIFIGLILLIFPFWLYVKQNELFQQLTKNIFTFTVLLIIMSIGFVFLLNGFNELTRSYQREKDLSIRRYRLERFNLDKKLHKLPKEYIREIEFPIRSIED